MKNFNQYKHMRYQKMKYKKHIFSVLCILLTLVLSGCGNKRYDLTRSTFMTGFNGKGRIAVAVKDQRPFVINGEKETTYLGRHFFGNGYPRMIYTRSGRSVAEDISKLIVKAIEKNGFQAESIYIGKNDELSLKNEKVAFQEYDRTILVAINQLRVETYFEAELKWDLSLEIFDESGSLLTRQENQGVDDAIIRNYGGHISGNQGQAAIQGETRRNLSGDV